MNNNNNNKAIEANSNQVADRHQLVRKKEKSKNESN